MNPAEGTTALGRSIRFKGELTGNESLSLDGSFEGTIKLTGSQLTVGPNATVSADIQVGEAVILGRVVGNITATGSVELRQSANVSGDVKAARLSIEESAVIKGRVELVSQGGSTASGKSGRAAEIPA